MDENRHGDLGREITLLQYGFADELMAGIYYVCPAGSYITFAENVGHEIVIAGTGCGLGGRVMRNRMAKLRAARTCATIANKKSWS
jgi:hypothetical protein